MTTNRPTFRARSGFASLALLAAALASGWVTRAAAQTRIPDNGGAASDSTPGRFIITSRHSGPPGTEVTLRPMYLPSVTPVQISIGGTRSGFEVLAQMMTDTEGELTGTTTFKVPEWTERDRTYMFMVLDLYFKPLAASPPFYVTGPDGTVLRQGRITDEGRTCTVLRGEGNEIYTLSGATGRLEPGDSVIVEGIVVESSPCKQGTTIDVRRIQTVTRSRASTGGADRSPAPLSSSRSSRPIDEEGGHPEQREGARCAEPACSLPGPDPPRPAGRR